MMFRPGRIIVVAAAIAFVVGCAGTRQSSTIPSGRGVSPQLNGGGGNVEVATMYIAGQGGVYMYNEGDSGNTPPVASTNGYYYQAAGPGGVTASIAGIATNAFGDLIVLQNYANPQGDGNSCQLVYIGQRQTTRAADATATTCSNHTGTNTTGLGIGITFTGPGQPAPAPSTFPSPGPSPNPSQPPGGFDNEVDVLMLYQHNGNPNIKACDGSTTDQFEVDRYTANAPIPTPGPSSSPVILSGTRQTKVFTGIFFNPSQIAPVSCNVLTHGATATYRAIAGGVKGSFFTNYDQVFDQTLEKYDAFGDMTSSGVLPGTGGPMAVSANTSTGVGYRLVTDTVSGQTTIYSFKVSGSTITFNSALGTFGNPIGGLAVGNDGTVYVGVNQPNGVTKLKVYANGQTEATSPLYVLNNPVRRANPSASPQAKITGIALAEP